MRSLRRAGLMLAFEPRSLASGGGDGSSLVDAVKPANREAVRALLRGEPM